MPLTVLGHVNAVKKKARKGYQGHVAVKKELFECTYYNTFFLNSS